MILQDLRRLKLLFALRQLFELTYYFGQTTIVGKTQRPAAERRKAGSEDHSIIRIRRGLDHFFFKTASSLVNHQKNKPPADRVTFKLHPWIALRVCWNRRTLCSFGITVQRSPPFFQRFVGRRRSAFKPVESRATFSSQHFCLTQPKQDCSGVISGAIGLLQRAGYVDGHVDPNLIDEPKRSHRHSPF